MSLTHFNAHVRTDNRDNIELSLEVHSGPALRPHGLPALAVAVVVSSLRGVGHDHPLPEGDLLLLRLLVARVRCAEHVLDLVNHLEVAVLAALAHGLFVLEAALQGQQRGGGREAGKQQGLGRGGREGLGRQGQDPGGRRRGQGAAQGEQDGGHLEGQAMR